MNTRRNALRNREVIKNNQKIENNFSGVTTRKRAALMALENSNYKLREKQNKIDNTTKNENLKEITTIQLSGSILNENKENQPITFEDLIKNQLRWPSQSEIVTPEQRKSFRDHVIARRNIIREHYNYLNGNGEPIWYYDDSEHYDEFMHAEYVTNIHDYLMDYELNYEPLGRNFLEGNGVIGYRQRYVLIDWIVTVHHNYDMCGDTLYLSISILDRFFKAHKSNLKITDLKLLGCIALFTAAKVEEVNPPELEKFIKRLGINVPLENAHYVEKMMIQTLGYRLSIPLSINFIRHYNILIHSSTLSHHISRYLCELSLQDYEASGYSVNQIGASCVFLAQLVCQEKEVNFETIWTDQLQCASGLLYTDIKPLVINLCVVLNKQPIKSNYRAITAKYSNIAYLNAFQKTLESPAYRSLLNSLKEEGVL